jgi:hypothetical protein
MKNTPKKVKPAYIVNMDNMQTLEDIDVEFGLAKHDAGLAISDIELAAIVRNACKPVRTLEIIIHDCDSTYEKKKPWYKRFWNWLFGKK